MNKFRVNFGNGQVDYPGSLKKCREYIKSLKDWNGAFIQYKECGEWFNIKYMGK